MRKPVGFKVRRGERKECRMLESGPEDGRDERRVVE